jgi:hypothetical protein
MVSIGSYAVRIIVIFLVLFSVELRAADEYFLNQQKNNLHSLIDQADSIIGLEVVIAAGDDKVFYSRFGHAMLRFVKADGDFATDSVLSLLANEDVNQIKWSKGLLGGYGILPFISSMGEFWEEYVKIEKRPLRRYILVSSPEQRIQLIKTIKAWSENPKLAGDYTFLKNNCVGALSLLLERSGFPSGLGIGPIIPTNFDEWLKSTLISPYPALEVKNTSSLFDDLSTKLQITLQDLLSGQNWPAQSGEVIEKNYSDLQIKQLLIQITQMPESIREYLVQNHNFNNGGASLEDVLVFKTVPQKLYKICEDQACIKDVILDAGQIWSKSELTDAFRKDDFAYWLAMGSPTDPDGNLLKENYNEKPKQFQRRFWAFANNIKFYQLLLGNL